MNLVRGLPVLASRSVFTWYGVRRRTRSPHTSFDSPIDTHTSVCTKSTPETAAPASSVIVISAPVRSAIPRAISTTSSGGRRLVGPARRTSAPISAPITRSDRPMLKRQSPTKAYDERVVRLAAGLVHGQEVGEHLRRVPLRREPVVDGHTGDSGRAPRRRPGPSRGTRSRRTSGRAPGRCRRPTPCDRAGSRTDRGRSRARPGRSRRPRTPNACGSRSSRRSGRSPCPPSRCASLPAYFAVLIAFDTSSR